jgi:hypothetical protein
VTNATALDSAPAVVKLKRLPEHHAAMCGITVQKPWLVAGGTCCPSAGPGPLNPVRPRAGLNQE